MNVNFDKGAVVLIATFVTTGRHTIWRSTAAEIEAHIENKIRGHAELQEFFETETA